jgi:hypothetical protein
MALGVVFDFMWFDFGYAAGVDVSGRYQAAIDEFAKPRSGLRVELVVVVHVVGFSGG